MSTQAATKVAAAEADQKELSAEGAQCRNDDNRAVCRPRVPSLAYRSAAAPAAAADNPKSPV